MKRKLFIIKAQRVFLSMLFLLVAVSVSGDVGTEVLPSEKTLKERGSSSLIDPSGSFRIMPEVMERPELRGFTPGPGDSLEGSEGVDGKYVDAPGGGGLLVVILFVLIYAVACRRRCSK
jgi:hypothetical protein